jgi:hypothetical protein
MGPVAPKSTTVETVLARLAARSHGVVTRQQLLAAGVTSDEIRQRLDTGGLLREHQGVYRVGHRAPSVEARYLAAVRACGEGAVLSGRAAAHLLGILKGAAPPPEVTAPTKRRVRGVATRRSREVQATTWRGIPITTVPAPSPTSQPTSPSMPWPVPATRPRFDTALRHSRPKP